MLLFVLVELADHHFVEVAWLLDLMLLLRRREVLKEQKLVLLLHAPLLAGSRRVLHLGELVLRRDRLSELRQRVIILHIEAVTFTGMVPHFPLFCKA